MGNILKIYHLKNEALLDLYKRLDKDLLPMPKKPDGSFDPYGLRLEDNDVDALRYAFISGVYTIEYNEGLAELLGRLNEFTTFDSQSTSALSENMDLWNNAVGRSYGKKTKTWNDLYLKLMKGAVIMRRIMIKRIFDPKQWKKFWLDRMKLSGNIKLTFGGTS